VRGPIMSHWADTARYVIDRVHQALPEGATLAERKSAVDAAYPFGPRAYSPYKTWLKARREYLCRYGYQPRNAPPESPLERMMRRAGA
jgi:hypothetical protein